MTAPQAASESAGVPSGLSSAEARARLDRFGRNAVPEPRAGLLAALAGTLWAPVPWMLEAAVVLQALLGDFLEAGLIAGLLAVNAGLAFAQSSRADAALAALKSRLALSASVRRDGAWTRLAVAELVVDDVVKLSLGAVVPADVALLDGAVLLDQSMLTGESLPVEAGAGARAYAGTLVRRGEATARVTATGAATRFGRTAELVRIAHADSTEQRAVLGVVRNLAVGNGALTALMLGQAARTGMSLHAAIGLVLTAILATVPVALPATFTLAAALAAQRLARRGVLPTRLAAVHEAATMDVLIADKTGTLTENALAVAALHPFAPASEADLLAAAAAASAEGGADPVDAAIRAAAMGVAVPERAGFVPFDPARKLAEARLVDGGTVLKGAYAAVVARVGAPDGAADAMRALAAQGARVLAVARVTADGSGRILGLIALADPPRADAAALIAALAARGVRTVMATGDAPETAAAIAARVGLVGPAFPGRSFPERLDPAAYAVFAGVLPEDKYHLVRALQAAGHVAGMCGDGANDAPALRQAGIGIAVASATDVAKAAAGIVLTEPGLAGVLAAVEEGRATFRRLLTYTLTMLVRKLVVVAYLLLGLLLTGGAVLTPLLMVLFLISNDFLTMSLATDRAVAGPLPEVWRMGAILRAGIAFGIAELGFALAVLVAGRHAGLPPAALRMLGFVTLMAGTQATLFALRAPDRLWRSRPGGWILASSLAGLAVTLAVALPGVVAAPLAPAWLGGVLVAALGFALVLDAAKRGVFAWAGLADHRIPSTSAIP